MIAERLKSLRLAQKLSQSELGRRAGIHPVTICEWEKGNTEGIKVQSIQKLAAALGVTPNELLGVTDEKSPGA